MTGTPTATAQVEQLIEHRLEEIEEQLRPFAELEEERQRLRHALDALRAGPSHAGETSARPARRRAGRRTSGSSRGARAPRGSNLKAIVSHVAANPGATAGEIATATGIARGVVYSATSRLSSSGKLEREPKPDGQVGYRAVG
jgi:hypothetical protein